MKLIKTCIDLLIKHYVTLLNIITALLFFLTILYGVLCVGGGGTLNDLDKALLEIEALEEKGLLDNPPDSISPTAKREIALVHNSKGLKAYIEETEQYLDNVVYTLKFLFKAFLFILFIRIALFFYHKYVQTRKV